MENFAKDINRTTATYLESCMHCGVCAEACQYYVQTEDPKYTPVWKLEVFKQAYKREASPFSFFYRLFNLKKEVSVEQLEEWQELIYDSCTMCGRCSLVCPMGIDIAGLVSMARHGMFKAGLIPHELHEVAKKAAETGSPHVGAVRIHAKQQTHADQPQMAAGRRIHQPLLGREHEHEEHVE